MTLQQALPVIQIVGIIAVAYFLLFRPSMQARKAAETMQSGLKKGDEVETSGGIIGKVRDIKEHQVTIESGTSTLVVARYRIVRVGGVTTEPVR